MLKASNIAESETLRVTLSATSLELLRQLAGKGVYGRNPAEVAARFIDAALQQFIERPTLKVPGSSKG